VRALVLAIGSPIPGPAEAASADAASGGGGGPRLCISNWLPGDADAAGAHRAQQLVGPSPQIRIAKAVVQTDLGPQPLATWMKDEVKETRLS